MFFRLRNPQPKALKRMYKAWSFELDAKRYGFISFFKYCRRCGKTSRDITGKGTVTI